MFDAMREETKAFKASVKTLKDIHHNARLSHNNPQKTIEEFVDATSDELAVEIIASLVNARAKWDGRISPRNAEWAKSHAVWDRDVIIRMGCYADDVIHSAHLDQLASEIRRKEV